MPGDPEPVWGMATLYPAQGGWTEDQYLELTDSTNRLIEFTDGHVEFLAMPTEVHQFILLYLMDCLRGFVEPRDLGKVLFSGLRLRIRPGMVREPDLVFISKDRDALRSNRFWSGADLVMEIVSPDDGSRVRDYEKKVEDYAAGKVAEYWIVDPQTEKVTVLSLTGDAYSCTGEYGIGDVATSVCLAGFVIDVKSIFDAPKK